MPPRYAYWTIIAGGLPTAFRAADREELLPTFHRIKEKHPDAQMKYFARGKLWESAEAAQTADKRPPLRDRAWRPGGTHRDPRQKFIDDKKQRNATMRKERWERKNAPTREPKPWARDRGTEQPAPSRQDKPWLRGQTSGKPAASRAGKPWVRGQASGKPASSRQGKPWLRGQGTSEPTPPARPRGPNREPNPSEDPEPTPPPPEEQTQVPPPGPPERGATGRRFQPGGRFPKGPRR
jgi:hypothetical protein